MIKNIIENIIVNNILYFIYLIFSTIFQ